MTAARVLGGDADTSVSEKTRRRVLKAAERLGYRRTFAAKALLHRKSFLVGMVYNDVNYVHASGVLCGLQEVLAPHDYVPVTLSHASVEQESTALAVMQRRNVDGLIFNAAVSIDGPNNVHRYLEMQRGGVPLVELFGRTVIGAESILFDTFTAGEMAAKHLLGLGHRSIALFTHGNYRESERSPGAHHDAYDQARGVFAAFGQSDLKPRIFTHEAPTDLISPRALLESARHGAHALLADSSTAPTGVVCYSIAEAIALIGAAQRLGKAVPSDLSIIVAGTDAMVPLLIDPSFTRIQLDAVWVGRRAASRMMGLLGYPVAETTATGLQMVVGETSGPPKPS